MPLSSHVSVHPVVVRREVDTTELPGSEFPRVMGPFLPIANLIPLIPTKCILCRAGNTHHLNSPGLEPHQPGSWVGLKLSLVGFNVLLDQLTAVLGSR
jgi:hypothetical protein